MKNIHKIVYILLCILTLSSLMRANAQTITQWNFDNLSVANNLTPATSTGTGSASAIGMSNTYGGVTSVNTDDVLVAQGTDTTSGSVNTGTSNQEWRIRGKSTGNGWNSAAPIGTQGAEFDMSTTGYTNIKLTFDLDISTQGEGLVQVEYSTDGSNWTNATLSYSGANASVLTNSSTTNNIVVGSYLDASIASPSSGSNWFNQITANLSSVSGVNNQGIFDVRIVNAATGSADVALETSQGQINNTSGNWRLDNVTLSGIAAAPEPSTYALMLGGFAMLVAIRRLRHNAGSNS